MKGKLDRLIELAGDCADSGLYGIEEKEYSILYTELIDDATRKDAEIAELKSRDGLRDINALFDRLGAQCGSCSATILTRGGMLRNHHGLSSTENGDLALCGYCMGLEADDMARQLSEPSENQALRAEVERLTGRLPHVAGEWMIDTYETFWRRCGVALRDEQDKPSPDNNLIALICDAVRMSREMVRRAAISPAAQPKYSK